MGEQRYRLTKMTGLDPVHSEWKRAQRADPDVSRLWVYMDRGMGPSPRERAAEG